MNNINIENGINFLKQLILIRVAEKKIAEKKKEGLIKGPVHLCIGQEAIPVAISANLNNSSDGVFGCHRSHGHIIALNCSIYKLFCEVLGKSDGLSKGYGGSMHLIDKDNKFYGSVPIVAGTVPLAAGFALANKLKSNKGIGVVYLGDGAIEEGVVYETLNMSACLGLPVLFVVENNLYSSHMFIEERQIDKNCIRIAKSTGVKCIQIDGNNFPELYEKSSLIIDYIRNTSKPAFIEANTYRWLGHVDWREDLDVGITRSREELLRWKEKDPLTHFNQFLIERFNIHSDSYQNFYEQIINEVDSLWIKAESVESTFSTNITKHNF